MRALGANAGDAGQLGLLTQTPGKLNANFFHNLLDIDTVWKEAGENVYEGIDTVFVSEI